jgi:branched-chain amino acid transport system permease protein
MAAILSPLRKVSATWWYAALAVIALVLPLPLSSYHQSVAVLAGIYILLGLSLNIIVGYAGLFQLGHAAFYALGAYTAAILNIHFGIPLLLLIPVAALVAGFVAWLLSRPILHLRGDYFCLVTIAFGEIVRIALNNDPTLGWLAGFWPGLAGGADWLVNGPITGGPNGLFGIDRPSLFGFTFNTPLRYYYLVLAFVAFTIFAVRRLEDSRLGRAWLYVREDQVAAEAMGIDATRAKLIAVVIGSAWAGVAGVLYVGRYTVIAPENFTFLESVIMFCIVVLGGSGSVPGVILGTVGMVVLPEFIRWIKDWRDGGLGIAMVVMMILRPQGLWPSQRARRAEEKIAISHKP